MMLGVKKLVNQTSEEPPKNVSAGGYRIKPLISITLQILLSCCHTLLRAETGRIFLNLPPEFMLDYHIPYSHDLFD